MTSFLMQWCIPSSASFFFSLKDPWHDPGFVALLYFLGAGGGFGEGAGCMAGAGRGFRSTLSFLQIRMKIEYLTQLKTTGP